MKKRRTFGHVGAVILLLFLCALISCKEKEQAAMAPPEVYVAPVVQKDVPVMMELVGQTKGSQDVEIRARVEGYLESVNFAEGSFINKGDFLYQIDPKPFEASLAAAKGNMETARARVSKAETDVARLKPLAEIEAVSKKELDDAVANLDAARAQLDAQKAAVDNATLNLGYTHITAPISGIIGVTRVKAGNLVGRGESTLLAEISIVDPILFRCGISEADYLELARRAEESKEKEKVSVDLILADGTLFPEKGTLDAIERAVDPTTGTLTVQLKFANPNKLLRPGQYGRVRFVRDVKKGALLVPQKAVQELQNLYNIAVVGADNKVTFKTVKMGVRVGELWLVEEGLSAGDRVVVEGLQRIRDGMTVAPKPIEDLAKPAGGEK